MQSHPDVGEKYYPDILAKLREGEAAAKSTLEVPNTDGAPQRQGRKRAPTIIVEKTEGPPAYGEDPGPDGSLLRKQAYEMRKMDAAPDEVRVVKEG